MKVVGLSGAQGGGKSSLLIELENRGWRLDKFRVSRAVQAQLGWEKLDTVMESWETMTTFQNEVFKQKYNHDLTLSVKGSHEFESVGKQNPDGLRGITCEADPELNHRNEFILTERTFADIAAYTTMWTWRHVDRGNVDLNTGTQFLSSYLTGCAHAHRQIYAATLLLPYMPDVIKWEEDPNRASRNDVDTVYEDVERFLERKLPIDHKRLTIYAKSVPDRATQVETFLRTL